jgi:Na+-transporting NADH:ubiquinone oxidoreductase subunit C
MMRALLGLSNEDPRKIVFEAIMLCLICSLVVASAAVLLEPIQDRAAALDRKVNVLLAAGLLEEGYDDRRVNELFTQIETRIVDFETGRFTTAVDTVSYDQRDASRDPGISVTLQDDRDVAGIGRRARYAPVYIIREDAELARIILPIHGRGLWSTMYGFLAIQGDLNTISSIRFYEHGETPGLGDRIDDDDWRALWSGKLIYDEDRVTRFTVVKGRVVPDTPDAVHQVDGLAGATLTANGVTNMIRFWLGPDGFGPFLAWLDTEGV